MQLFALDEKDQIVSVVEANKKNDYFCLECQTTVRKRGGFLKKDHFYHIDQHRVCRQNGKSLEHLHIQQHLQKLFPSALMEKRFDSIHRIADVCVEDFKIIFEVQCSPITAKEIRERNLNYESLGYRVIWILHEKQYNKFYLSSAEHFLLSHPHYFTDFNESGEGLFYDQLDFIYKGKRYPFMRKEISLEKFNPLSKDVQEKIYLTKFFNNRFCHWPIYFTDDIIHHLSQKTILEQKELVDGSVSKYAFLENRLKPNHKNFIYYLKLFFRVIINYYLEILTRK